MNTVDDVAATARPRAVRGRLFLAGTAIFVCGLLLGAAGALFFVRYRILHALRHPEEAPARITAHIRRKLELTPHQAEEVERVVLRRQRALQEIRREVQPRVEAELDRAEQEIAALLTPVQKAKWREWFKRVRTTWIPPLPPAGEGKGEGSPGGP